MTPDSSTGGVAGTLYVSSCSEMPCLPMRVITDRFCEAVDPVDIGDAGVEHESFEAQVAVGAHGLCRVVRRGGQVGDVDGGVVGLEPGMLSKLNQCLRTTRSDSPGFQTVMSR